MVDWQVNTCVLCLAYSISTSGASCRDKITPATCDELVNIRDEQLLGPREMRTPECPTQSNGVWSGGVAWERHEDAVTVREDGRCYTVAQSFEGPARITCVTAAAKTYDGELGDHGRIRKRLNTVSSTVYLCYISYTLQVAGRVVVDAMAQAPSHIRERLQIQHQLMNIDPLGSSETVGCYNDQLNVAPAARHGFGEHTAFMVIYCADYSHHISAGDLHESLGFFGGKHKDQHDSIGGYTCMTAISDLPDDYHAGVFHCLELGIFIVPSDIMILSFSGLRWHCGTPPTAPPGEDPVPWAYRLTLICYPPAKIMDGTSSIPLFTFPNVGNSPPAPFRMFSEMIHPKYVSLLKICALLI